MRTEPKTAADLLACPETSGFSEITVTDCAGLTTHFPVVETAEVTPVGPDSIAMCVDADGNVWRPVLRKGKWYKQRVFL